MPAPLTDHPMPVFTADMLRHAVRRMHVRFHTGSVVWVNELRTKAGGDGGERFIDLWGIRPNVPHCTALSYEIKVSRSDFLRDMKIAAKHDGARALSNEFWFVAPPGVIKPSEVPAWAGLIEPVPSWTEVSTERGYRWMTTWERWDFDERLKAIVKAPKREKPAPSWSLVVSLLRRDAIEVPSMPPEEGGYVNPMDDVQALAAAQEVA